ncbi:MarR family winged helix-turn-helix transcriptional regulator [Melaminivora alkalimesophila]|uniref:MarR family winged helix-turn-helix transcriptional regulator n=1 Tax=Melaminivora alkalimesophila TaxID=1165852 RepID=UPI000593FC6B|nr:MarR family transcriptional regulator [Melaminivora alkalimesophila]
MTSLRTEIPELWRQLNRQMHERFRATFRESDIQPHAFFMLRQITTNPGVTVSELARRVGMVKSHVSKTVDQLTRQGYLEKRADEADQRLVRLYATRSAQSLMAETEAIARRAWDEVLDRVAPEQLETVAEGLRILLSALEQSIAHPFE